MNRLFATFFALGLPCIVWGEVSPPRFPGVDPWMELAPEKPTERTGNIREQFIEVETVAQLDYWQQKQHLRRLYFELLPQFRQNFTVGHAIPDRPIKMTGTPAEVADRVIAHPFGGTGVLNNEALIVCNRILQRHPREVGPWVAKNFSQPGPVRLYDWDLLFPDHFPALVTLLRSPDHEMAVKAARLLCTWQINNPRAIGLIVQRFPTLEAGDIETLQINRRADPSLVALLSSADAGIRTRAVKALRRSMDPMLEPLGRRLLNDPNEEVRKEAALMLRFLRGEEKVFPAPIQIVDHSL